DESSAARFERLLRHHLRGRDAARVRAFNGVGIGEFGAAAIAKDIETPSTSGYSNAVTQLLGFGSRCFGRGDGFPQQRELAGGIDFLLSHQNGDRSELR